MSGHSKWSTIKRKKGAADSKRGKLFTKLIKEITIAAKSGGGDPEGNPALRLAVANAKGANMPKDNISRAINKAYEKDSATYQETTFEGYANGGVAIFVECLTDNNQRTVANVRSYFNKFGGSLGTNGSLSFVFERKGIFEIPQGNLVEDDFMMEIIDAGADDVEHEEDYYTVSTLFENFGKMQKRLEEMKIDVESAKLERIPLTYTAVSIETAQKVLRLIEMFEEDDDVQNVYHNMEMTEEIANAL
ncbi:MAG: YebC/PmpR family DNA-binding transcriptional regulator [Bacteroidetes bacterium]|nr:YebC/PmpR family DNA-binding transcriptional regulator [Bacteroidota bacterium]MBU1718784.1 YebC/PmpR family DNA-binding transcriptional regulator [Bacteroidota bacterium]